MMVLYHCMSARSFRPLWTLEELGMECDLRMLPFPPRVFEKSYLDVNPLGTIPAFFDGDTRMTESAAICQYLVTRYGPTPLNVTPEEPQYGAFLNYLHFGEATLTFPQTLVLRYASLEPEERRQPQVAEDYTKWFLARLRGIDALLKEQPYLCGERFTVADISVGYALMLAYNIGIGDGIPAAVADYWARLEKREGYRNALARQKEAAEAQGIGQGIAGA